MAAQQQGVLPTVGWREPDSRRYHSTAVVGDEVYLWAGNQNRMPEVHDSAEKQTLVSSVEVFNVNTGCWEQRTTRGTPPLGVAGYSCVAVRNDLYYFGGECGHSGCYHNSVHTLSTSTLQWRMLAPTTSEDGAPMKKRGCGVVHFTDEEDLLFVVGGYGPTPSSHQREVQYGVYCNDNGYVHTIEQHIFCLSTSGWSSLKVTGQAPPPCSEFTLTTVGEKRAAMYGGWDGWDEFNHLFIVELGRYSVHWSNISTSIGHSVEWPQERNHHAATHLSGPLFVIVGGEDQYGILNDMWLCDTTTKLWKKLPLPNEYVAERYGHSVSTLQLGPHCMWLILFGGRYYKVNTVIIELIQGGDGEWSVGRVLERDTLSNNTVYLREGKRKGVPVEGVAGRRMIAELEQESQHLQEKVQQLQEKRLTQQHQLETEETLQQLQPQLTCEQEAANLKTREMEEENHGLHQQQQEELKRLQQKAGEDEVRVTASKEEQQRLVQVVGQWQKMGRARDVQISQLQNEKELVQDKFDTLTVSYQQLQVSSNEEKQQLQDQITQLESGLPAQQLPTSSSLSDHHQKGSHTQNAVRPWSVDTVDTGVQADYLAVAPGFLRGVEVYRETVLEVVGDKPQKLEWPGYGFYMEVPDGALASGVTASVGVKVILSGQFKLPDNRQLISAIYWISSSEVFLKEVAINIQHFAAITSEEQCSKFSFIIAKCSQKELPYTFHEKEGSFNPHTQYGTIKFKQFSMLIGETSPEAIERQCFTSLKFYKPMSSTLKIVDYIFVVVYNHELFFEFIREELHGYSVDKQNQLLAFENDVMVLDLPADDSPPIVVDGWKILPLTYPQIAKVDIQQFKSGRILPACKIELEWIGSGEPKPLSHKVNIIGAKEPANYFDMHYNPQEFAAHEEVATRGQIRGVGESYQQALRTTPTLLELKTMQGTDGTSLRIIERVAAGDYMTFGMYLLQDENGDEVEMIENDYRHRGDQAIAQAIIRKWLRSGGPTCNYQHLIECLNQSGLREIAELIADNQ